MQEKRTCNLWEWVRSVLIPKEILSFDVVGLSVLGVMVLRLNADTVSQFDSHSNP